MIRHGAPSTDLPSEQAEWVPQLHNMTEPRVACDAPGFLTQPARYHETGGLMSTIVPQPTSPAQPPRRRRPALHDLVDAQLPTTACVLWPGKVTPEGYGPYRLTYVRHNGPVAPGLMLDHVCHSRAPGGCPGGPSCPHRACVNPAHMEPVTAKVNHHRSLITRGFRVKSPTGWPVGGRRCI